MDKVKRMKPLAEPLCKQQYSDDGEGPSKERQSVLVKPTVSMSQVLIGPRKHYQPHWVFAMRCFHRNRSYHKC